MTQVTIAMVPEQMQMEANKDKNLAKLEKAAIKRKRDVAEAWS